MMPSLKTFGFEYQYGGRKFAFSMEAESIHDAQERLAALALASPVGVLVLDTQVEKKDNSN